MEQSTHNISQKVSLRLKADGKLSAIINSEIFDPIHTVGRYDVFLPLFEEPPLKFFNSSFYQKVEKEAFVEEVIIPTFSVAMNNKMTYWVEKILPYISYLMEPYPAIKEVGGQFDFKWLPQKLGHKYFRIFMKGSGSASTFQD